MSTLNNDYKPINTNPWGSPFTEILTVILIIWLCICLGSCGLFKKVSKTKQDVDSTYTMETRKTAEMKRIETIDTNIFIPPDTIDFGFLLPQFGDTLTLKDKGTGIRVTTRKDKSGNTKIDLQVTKDADSVRVQKTVVTTLKTSDTTSEKVDLNKKVSNKEVVKKSGIRWYWYVIAVVFLVFVVFLNLYFKGQTRGIKMFKKAID